MVYELKWDFSHLTDGDYDASLLPIPGIDGQKIPYYFTNIRRYGVEMIPNPLIFEAN